VDKLRAEWPAILRWMIDGCLDWQANGLLRPDTVKVATADYFETQNSFAQWLCDECDAEPGNMGKMGFFAELYASWTTYAKAAGEMAGSKKAFGETLTANGFTRKILGNSKTTVYAGIKLKLKGGFSNGSD
jgi:putative DNA primase/helicase